MDLDRIIDIHKLYQNESYVDAEIGIRNLLQQNPNNSDVLRLGALTALSLNQVVTAQSRLMTAAQFCQFTAEMANTLGNILKAAGEWSKAEEAYKQAIELDQHYVPVRSNLIDLLIVSGQARRALAEIDRQSEVYGNSDFLNFARANALMQAGRFNEALISTDAVTEAFDTTKIANLKMQLYFHLEKYDDMQNMLESIPIGSGHAVDSLARAVNAFAMQDMWEKGHEIINTACKKPEITPNIFVKSIELLTRGGFIDEAKKLRDEAQTRFKTDADILADKASYYMAEGRYLDSCDIYENALAIRPGDYKIIIQYARACLSAGKFDVCQNLIQGALQQAPNSQLLFALAATLQRARGEEYHTFYDYDQFIQVYDLQPPADYESIEAFNLALKDCLERHHSFKAEPLNQSLRKGIQTDKDLYLIDDPVLKSFFDIIDDPIKNYMKKIGHDSKHPLKRHTSI